MPDLDPAAVSVVAEFAADMNLGEIVKVSGAFSFDFEKTGRLSILSDDTGARILVSLTRGVMLTDLIGYGRLMGCAGYHPTPEILVRAGVTASGQPVLATAGSRIGFDRLRLEKEFTILREAFDRAGL
jgi:hypothetical protein